MKNLIVLLSKLKNACTSQTDHCQSDFEIVEKLFQDDSFLTSWINMPMVTIMPAPSINQGRSFCIRSSNQLPAHIAAKMVATI